MNYISVKEKQLPITIDFSVIRKTCEKLNIQLSEFEQTINNPSHTLIVFGEGLKRGHKKEGLEFNYTDEQIEDFLNEDGVYAEFIKAFTNDVLKMFTVNKDSKKN